MRKSVKLAAAAAMALGFAFGTAQATTIYISGSSIELECLPPVCQGFTGGGAGGFPAPTLADPVIMSDTTADLYQVHPPNPENAAAALNALLGENMFTEADAVAQSGASGDTASFWTSAAYLVFNLGNSPHLEARTFFIALTNPGLVHVFYDKMGQEGGGLSGALGFGTTSVVPLPAGLLLFLTGLAGIGFLGRYKAKRRREPEVT
jgi:hypothetical protein